ncbi:MAG: (Fe-S)-binding protein [Candidatus Thermoplasmatota archaeon]|nr:(Fe-S)-binding protein [Candidatus Thermoplasmatota archaeon]
MRKWVSHDIDLCIGCNRCMEACPVTKKHITIADLNMATEPETEVPQNIIDFSFNCVQCGRCVPVCPAGARRDYMVLFIKYKLRAQKPGKYDKYIQIKDQDKRGFELMKQKLYTTYMKLKHRDLRQYMGSVPSENKEILFYPGCYINSPEVIRRTMKLLNFVGTPYNILGGLNTCCGIPHLLIGEFELAEKNMDLLHAKINRSTPKIVITGCAECFEALVRIKAKHKTEYDILTVTEFLLTHRDKFPKVRLRPNITLHDSCRITRRYNRGEAPRKAIEMFSKLVEMENSREKTLCCYYWNMGHDGANDKNRKKRLNEARGKSKTLACDCITCYEKYVGLDDGIEVIDILELFEEALDKEGGAR